MRVKRIVLEGGLEGRVGGDEVVVYKGFFRL